MGTPPTPDRSELLAAAAELHRSRTARRPAPRAPRRRRRLRFVTRRNVAIALAVDILLGGLGWHLFSSGAGGAEGAVEQMAAAVAHRDWAAVYGELCSLDQRQYSAAELSQAGDAALLQLGGVASVRQLTVTPVGVPVGPLHWPAARISGELEPVVGQPSTFSVTAVRDVTSWRVCLSVGGYSSSALGIDVPISGTASSP